MTKARALLLALVAGLLLATAAPAVPAAAYPPYVRCYLPPAQRRGLRLQLRTRPGTGWAWSPGSPGTT